MKRCETCEPVEQIRGEMGPGDYYDVIAANRAEKFGSVPEPEKYGVPWRLGTEPSEDVLNIHLVEINDDNKDSFRICCKKCGRASPWSAKDFPGMPDAGADFIRKKWAEGKY